MTRNLSRRSALKLAGGAALAGVFAPRLSLAAEQSPPDYSHGVVIGELTAAKAGLKILADGGNAVDAAVASALAAAVVAPQSCGLGGYGGSAVIALARKRQVTAIDFNTTAPAAMREDTFKPGADGKVRDRINEHGWLAAGVPGTLAGLDFAWRRFGKLSFAQVFAPAIEFAEKGFPVTSGMAAALRGTAAQLRKDTATAKLLLNDGEPFKAGDTFRNPEAAEMLKSLVARKSVRDFYHGDIAHRIAEAFEKNGGLVAAKDLAAYEPREVKPLEISWRGLAIRTAPLTAGGITPLQALLVLKSLGWDARTDAQTRLWLRIEAERAAWQDRLQKFGDTAQARALTSKLLSREGASELAAKIENAVKSRKPLPPAGEPREHAGTIHLSVADKEGNMVALTLTHGNSFGACVTVPGLGLTLGHGMSRFEPQPGHPNSPGPGKRPLHNMCPTILSRGDRPVFAVGGTGGRRIPTSVFTVLLNLVALDASVEDAVAAPRLHTEGGLDVAFEAKWPKEEREFFNTVGYKVSTGPIATVSAVAFNPATGECRAARR